jgi:hypothetical protein
MFARDRRPEESHMRRSLSHRYQQFQSQFQLGAISFFDDRHPDRVPYFWPVLPEVGLLSTSV